MKGLRLLSLSSSQNIVLTCAICLSLALLLLLSIRLGISSHFNMSLIRPRPLRTNSMPMLVVRDQARGKHNAAAAAHDHVDHAHGKGQHKRKAFAGPKHGPASPRKKPHTQSGFHCRWHPDAKSHSTRDCRNPGTAMVRTTVSTTALLLQLKMICLRSNAMDVERWDIINQIAPTRSNGTRPMGNPNQDLKERIQKHVLLLSNGTSLFHHGNDGMGRVLWHPRMSTRPVLSRPSPSLHSPSISMVFFFVFMTMCSTHSSTLGQRQASSTKMLLPPLVSKSLHRLAQSILHPLLIPCLVMV